MSSFVPSSFRPSPGSGTLRHGRFDRYHMDDKGKSARSSPHRNDHYQDHEDDDEQFVMSVAGTPIKEETPKLNAHRQSNLASSWASFESKDSRDSKTTSGMLRILASAIPSLSSSLWSMKCNGAVSATDLSLCVGCVVFSSGCFLFLVCAPKHPKTAHPCHKPPPPPPPTQPKGGVRAADRGVVTRRVQHHAVKQGTSPAPVGSLMAAQERVHYPWRHVSGFPRGDFVITQELCIRHTRVEQVVKERPLQHWWHA